MLYSITAKNGGLLGAAARRAQNQVFVLHLRLLLGMLCWLNGAVAHAQTRVLPSHGKIKLDSYNYLLRDVHPASQAQANYLQNRLYLSGLKKAERLERKDRLDAYGERQFIQTLRNYNSHASRVAAGRTTSARNLTAFWVLVSVFGDHAEVYDALSSDVPPMSHEEFAPTSRFIQIVHPSGELARPPLLLEGSEGVDASKFQLAWSTLAKNLYANCRMSAREVAEFRNCVALYRKQGAVVFTKNSPASGRLQARRYLTSLGSLADALYSPQHATQIQQYVEQGGYSYYGGSMLGLIQHMLRNRVTPAQGSTAQIALAEVARPISRVLEQEIALHYERIDSLAAGEGNRPYAAEHRGEDAPVSSTPGVDVSQWMGPVGTGS
jgi:hypothetical protein